MTIRHMGELLEAKQLNTKIQYELEEGHQLNYDSFIHEFAKIAVSGCKFSFLEFHETNLIVLVRRALR